MVTDGWRDRLSDIGISSDSDWQSLSSAELASSSATVLKCYRIGIDDQEGVYFKRYVYPWLRGIRFWLRPSKAAVEVFGLGRLRQLGIPTPEVIAFGEVRTFGVLRSAFVATREIPDSMDLATFAGSTWNDMPRPQQREVYRQISTQIIGQLRTAHQAHFFHRDLKWRNILIQEHAGDYQCIWIDCPKATVNRVRRARGIVVDLSSLARAAFRFLGIYDRARFVRDYLGPERKPGDLKRLLQKVGRHLGRRPPKSLCISP